MELDLKQEITERMKIMKLNNQIITDFETEGTIYVSEIKGDLIKASKELMLMVKEYEDQKQVKIYHIIHQETESKDLSIFLYVDPKSKEWKEEKRDIELGYDCALCFIKFKETREIGIKVKNGKVNVIYI